MNIRLPLASYAQVGLLPHERDARLFLAYLITQDIEATCEREGESWAVWIHDEDHLNHARQLLEDYRLNPDDPRYQSAQRLANQKVQESIAKREAASKNVVEVGGKWRGKPGGTSVGRNAPLVFILIAISVLIAVFTQVGDDRASLPMKALSFVEVKPEDVKDGKKIKDIPPFRDVLQGQVWRLITPIFIHFSVSHILFNGLALFMLGSQVEERRGPYFFTLLLVVSAVVSNSLQALHNPFFGGLSGVVYAVFGYMWIVVLYGNRERYDLSPSTIAFCLGWLILCIVREIPATSNIAFFIPTNIANVAHLAGLIVGMAFGAIARKT